MYDTILNISDTLEWHLISWYLHNQTFERHTKAIEDNKATKESHICLLRWPSFSISYYVYPGGNNNFAQVTLVIEILIDLQKLLQL